MSELTSMLEDEMNIRARICADNAAAANRTLRLSELALEEHEPGSPWAIVEEAVRATAVHVVQAETQNTNIYKDAALALSELDRAAPAEPRKTPAEQALQDALTACDEIIDNKDGHKPQGPPHPSREQATAVRLKAIIESSLRGIGR